MASLRTLSSGAPWSHSSTATLARPNRSVGLAGVEPAVEAGHAHPGGTLLSRQLGLADHAGQCGVADRVASQYEEVTTVGVGLTRGDVEFVDGEFCPEDGGEADVSCRFGEPDHTVEPVVIGDRQGLEVEPDGFLHQLLGRRRAVEEAEARVAVKLGVGLPAGSTNQCGGFVGRSAPRPGRAVATVGTRRSTRVVVLLIRPAVRWLLAGQPLIGECLLDGAPRHRRIAEPHRGIVPNTCSIAPVPPTTTVRTGEPTRQN